MGTLDERFHVHRDSVWSRLCRDVHLLGFLATIACTWIVAAGRVRRAYAKAAETGETFYIDHLGGRAKYD